MLALREKAVTQRDECVRSGRQLRDAFAALSETLERSGSCRAACTSPGAPVAQRAEVAPDPREAARQRLHERYAATGDLADRDALMTSYDGFARSLALKYRHRDSVDDLVQTARIGLLHAIDRFEPALGRPFTAFAQITITGELKRHMRDKTWAMRVPRSLQEDYLSVMRSLDELTALNGCSPSIEAVAAHCQLSIDRVVEAVEVQGGRRALSVDAPRNTGSDEQPMELAQEEVGFQAFENREFLDHLLGRLSERDRRIMELRFVQEMTQAEIAAEVGVSQMCISRVLVRTLGRLRLWARTAAA